MTARLTSRQAGLVVSLRAAAEADAGGKAGGLGRLIRLGVAVPAGWVLTLQADRQRRAGELSGQALDSLIDGCLTAASYSAGRRFAVRSSASTEDSVLASYAGQFRTELNVPAGEVPSAVRRVAASVDSPSAQSYARRLGVKAPDAMAVLVQDQVNPFLAGVCFTAHPVTGAACLVLEYARGLGDVVASGGELDGSLVLPRSPCGGFGGEGLAAVESLASLWLGEVALLALWLEAMLGGPQDVEWAVDERGLWIIQARPITTIRRLPGLQSAMRSTP